MSPQSNSALQKLWGAILMVAGCCIGAGMLGLPLVTATAGFLPTVVAFFVSWLFMAATGLLLLEANLWFGQGVNLMTLTEKLLGKGAKWIVTGLFLFLFYSLMVAFLSGGGFLISEFLYDFFDLTISPALSSTAIVFFFGTIVFFGASAVDLVNRFLMIGLGFSYLALLYYGLPHGKIMHLAYFSFSGIIAAFPAMIISFGYQNLVPSLTDYLKGNVRHLRYAILIGSAIPLVIYLLWDGMILALLPQGEHLNQAIQSGAMVTTLLRSSVGESPISGWMQGFSFFALITTIITVALSFVDFLADGLHIKKTTFGSLLLVGLVFFPPLAFSFIYPTIFLMALNYAGAFGAVILFGIIPVIMAWKGRYIDKRKGQEFIPGGKWTLGFIGLFSLFVFLMQLKNELGV